MTAHVSLDDPNELFRARIHRHARIASTQLRSLSTSLFPPAAKKYFDRSPPERPRGSSACRTATCGSCRSTAWAYAEDRAGRPAFERSAQINELREYLAGPPEGGSRLPPAASRGRKAPDPHGRELQRRLGQDDNDPLSLTVSRACRFSRSRDRPRSSGVAFRHVRLPAGVRSGENETLYGAIRYDEDRRPLHDIIRGPTSMALGWCRHSRTHGVRASDAPGHDRTARPGRGGFLLPGFRGHRSRSRTISTWC